ncbi:MAG TPA: hypothetical protein VGG06_27335 [Thermoanaerobaculia bacterium]
MLSIALHGRGTSGVEVSEVLLFCPQNLPAPPGAVPFAREIDLLRAFCGRAIVDAFLHDREKLVAYNLKDARLVRIT